MFKKASQGICLAIQLLILFKKQLVYLILILK